MLPQGGQESAIYPHTHQATMPAMGRVRSDEDERTKKWKFSMTSNVHLGGLFAAPPASTAFVYGSEFKKGSIGMKG
jgi:hypothetical protein